MDIDRNYDVVVAGGGPAGACAAALVAEQGHRVLLLERSLEPQFKVGESLMPATYWTLERLGVNERMHESGFMKKHSVQFYPGSGKGTAPFYFSDIEKTPSAQTWQVVRKDFDQMLLDNAAEKGAEVHRGASVAEVLLDGDRAVGVVASLPTGERKEIAAKVVVDATGQRALVADRLRIKEINPDLKHASFFTHYDGAHRDEGVDEGATIILHNEDESAWFWYIPLPGNTVSVGVVSSLEYLVKSRSGDPQTVFEEELQKCRPVLERIDGATQSRPVQVARDFSYVSRQMAGDGWILAGDAFGFLDPIYSSGVFLALKSGEFAADAIHDALTHDDPSEARLRQNEATFLQGMDDIRQLVYAFYNPDFSFSKFLKKYPECREDIVHILIGNVYRHSVARLREPLAEMCGLPRPAAETATLGGTA